MIHILQLARISPPKNVLPIAQATSRASLENFMRKHRVEAYRDEDILRFFRKGSPLEDYFPPGFSDEVNLNGEYAFIEVEDAPALHEPHLNHYLSLELPRV